MVEQLHQQYVESARSLRRFVLVFLLVWAAGYLISAGIVEEGSVASFKIDKVKHLLLGWPPMIGALGYLLAVSIAAEGLIARALSQCYRHLLPKASELELEYLLLTSTFFGVERFVDEPRWGLRHFRKIWLLAIMFFLLFAPFFALGHVSYLLWLDGSWGCFASGMSVAAGLVFWLRGFTVMLAALRISK